MNDSVDMDSGDDFMITCVDSEFISSSVSLGDCVNGTHDASVEGGIGSVFEQREFSSGGFPLHCWFATKAFVGSNNCLGVGFSTDSKPSEAFQSLDSWFAEKTFVGSNELDEIDDGSVESTSRFTEKAIVGLSDCIGENAIEGETGSISDRRRVSSSSAFWPINK